MVSNRRRETEKAELERLMGEKISPHRVSRIAFLLFFLRQVLGLVDDPKVQEFYEVFIRDENSWDPVTVLEDEVHYVIRICNSPGRLDTEEWLLLFSLNNHIHAFDKLGIELAPNLRSLFEESLRDRFKADPKGAKFAAIRYKEDWNKELWWMKENL